MEDSTRSVRPAGPLHGQVALVTGASSGLGARFAKVLAEAGAAVALTARRVDRLEELAIDIRAGGGTCCVVPLDVTDPATFSAAFDEVENRLGACTVLVNNAGIPDANFAVRLPLDLVQRVIATNLTAPYVLSCEFARRLMQRELPGRIINLSAIGAHSYSRNSAASLYATTKAAVERMTEVLAIEWARFGINVNAIAPGLIHSEMTEGMISRIGDVSSTLPRKRIGDPSVLDSTLLFLASPDSSYVTGTVVKADDGQTTR